MREKCSGHRRRKRWIARQLLPRRKSLSPHIRKMLRLSDLQRGDRCVVVNIDTNNEKKLQILLSRGILPGRLIYILQTFPSFIFQVGQTQYAVDTGIAEAVFVKPQE